MDLIQEFLYLDFIPPQEAMLRIILALVFGFVIGLDRNWKNKPIDFRAYMIVAVTTCMIAMMGNELYEHYATADNILTIDLSKIIAGVLTGIGFLGAGAIIKRSDNEVIGTATGASIWASGGIGLALGFGFYGLAFFTFFVIALVLVIGGFLMPHIHGKKDAENPPKK